MFKEAAIKNTTILKTLERIEGTEGAKDYFVIYTGKVSYCLKVDFSTNFLGQPTGLFARVRMVKPEGKDIFNMADWMYDSFNHLKVKKSLAAKSINAGSLKIDPDRVSFVVMSQCKLEDYGQLTDEGYDDLVTNLQKDMKALGTRIYKAMRVLKEVPAETQKTIYSVMEDFVDMYKPDVPTPEKKKKVKGKANVVPIKAKAKPVDPGSKSDKDEPKKK